LTDIKPIGGFLSSAIYTKLDELSQQIQAATSAQTGVKKFDVNFWENRKVCFDG